MQLIETSNKTEFAFGHGQVFERAVSARVRVLSFIIGPQYLREVVLLFLIPDVLLSSQLSRGKEAQRDLAFCWLRA